MARYHFHTANGCDHHDDEGVELGSLQDAKAVAVKTLSELLRDHAGAFWMEEACRLKVTDPEGLIFFTIEVYATMAPVARKQ